MNQSKRKGTIILWLIMVIVALFLYLFNNTSFYINTSYLITLYTVCLVIRALDKKIPLRELTIFFTAIQYLFAPSLDYQVLGKYTYFHMRVTQEVYYGYIFPAFFAFFIALFFPLGRRLAKEADIINRVKAFRENNRRIGITLICVGIGFQYIYSFTGTIQSLNFIFTLLSLMRFIGVLYLWLSDSKYKKLIIALVLLDYMLSVLRQAIFIQLIILLIFLYAYYALLNKPNKVKVLLTGAVAVVLLFVLQSIKTEYRKSIWRTNADANKISVLSDAFSKRYLDENKKTSFMYTAAAVNLRLNQGWVMETIMRNIPVKRPFFEGEVFWDEFYGLILPRFIASDKAVVQSSDKFQRFAGYKLKNYTIAVGIFGDGYGNFGINGGIFFCFCVGLFFNLSIFLFYRLSNKYPSLLLWSIFIFFYLIRAGDDFYIITNWIIKSSLMLFFVFLIFKRHLIQAYQPVLEDKLKRRINIALN